MSTTRRHADLPWSNDTYRMVYFVPSLARGERYLLGALTKVEGEVCFVPVDEVPGERALGGEQSLEVYKMCLEIIKAHREFDRLPRGFNSLGVLGPEVVLAPGLGLDWVRANVFRRDS